MNSTGPTTTPIQEKWGEAINDGFVVIPSTLLRHQDELGLESGEVLVLMNLIMAWWKADDWPFPQTATLAKRMGVSRRTVQRHIGTLQKRGYIRRLWGTKRRYDERAAPRYDLSGIVAELQERGRLAHPNRKPIVVAAEG